MGQTDLLEKIKKMQLAYQQEVEDFIDFILEKKINTAPARKNRTLGLLKGKLKMHPGFDDFNDYM